MTLRRRRFPIVTLLIAATAPVAANAYERALSTDVAYLRWDRSRTIGVALEGNPPDPATEHSLRRAIDEWNRCVHRLESRPGGSDAEIFVRMVDRPWPHRASLAAHTAVESDERTGRIRQVTIDLDRARRWSVLEATPADALDLESVLLHELGHAHGLAHSRHPESVMHAGVRPGAKPRRQLTEDDCSGLRATLPAGEPAAPDARERTPPSRSRLDTPVVTIAAAITLLIAVITWGRRRRPDRTRSPVTTDTQRPARSTSGVEPSTAGPYDPDSETSESSRS